jgi:hypothetical protein
MELTFQTTVLIIAIAILIFSLVVIGFMLKRSYTAQKWPPNLGSCPDYWDVSGNMCIPNTNGINAGNAGSTGNTGISSFDYTKPEYQGNCNLYKWASTNNVIWDGINSGNGEKPAKC